MTEGLAELMCSKKRRMTAFCRVRKERSLRIDRRKRRRSFSCQTHLAVLVEDRKRTLILGFRRILEILDILRHNLPIRNQIPLPVNHVRNHHDAIDARVGKLERRFGGFDIKGEDDGFGTVHEVFAAGDPYGVVFRVDGAGVPETDAEVWKGIVSKCRFGLKGWGEEPTKVDSDSNVVRHIVLANVLDVVQRIRISLVLASLSRRLSTSSFISNPDSRSRHQVVVVYLFALAALAVAYDGGQDGFADRKEVTDIREIELDDGSLAPEEVIWLWVCERLASAADAGTLANLAPSTYQIQIFLFDSSHLGNDPFKTPSKIVLDFGFGVFLWVFKRVRSPRT